MTVDSPLSSVKVLYDISVLGQGYLHQRARTGIFRVVENLAENLAASPECQLSFCVTQYLQLLDASFAYLKSQPKFSHIPFIHSSFSLRFLQKLQETLTSINFKVQPGNYKYNEEKKLTEYLQNNLGEIAQNLANYGSYFDGELLSQFDIFHSPYDRIPPWIKQHPHPPQIFLTIYDLIPVLFPQFLLSEQIPLLFQQTLKSINQKDWVLCISENTKNDLCNYLNFDPSRVFVTHLAAEPTYFYPCKDSEKISQIREKYKIPDLPYLLSLSTLEPRKNIDHLIRCFAQLIAQEHLKDLYLVLVGTAGWKYDNILEEISKNGSLKDRIIFTGYVPEEDLAALYSGALVFIYPSHYEGFGLPPLEAMQCGIPVITSNTSSLPEVIENAGIMLDPQDQEGLCHSILQLYNHPSLRESMAVKSLAQAKKFNWKRCTQETLEAYRIALS